MIHDPLCTTLKAIMVEDSDMRGCQWCRKIAKIRADETERAYSRGFDSGYLRGKDDAEAERRWLHNG